MSCDEGIAYQCFKPEGLDQEFTVIVSRVASCNCVENAVSAGDTSDDKENLSRGKENTERTHNVSCNCKTVKKPVKNEECSSEETHVKHGLHDSKPVDSELSLKPPSTEAASDEVRLLSEKVTHEEPLDQEVDDVKDSFKITSHSSYDSESSTDDSSDLTSSVEYFENASTFKESPSTETLKKFETSQTSSHRHETKKSPAATENSETSQLYPPRHNTEESPAASKILKTYEHSAPRHKTNVATTPLVQYVPQVTSEYICAECSKKAPVHKSCQCESRVASSSDESVTCCAGYCCCCPPKKKGNARKRMMPKRDAVTSEQDVAQPVGCCKTSCCTDDDKAIRGGFYGNRHGRTPVQRNRGQKPDNVGCQNFPSLGCFSCCSEKVVDKALLNESLSDTVHRSNNLAGEDSLKRSSKKAYRSTKGADSKSGDSSVWLLPSSTKSGADQSQRSTPLTSTEFSSNTLDKAESLSSTSGTSSTSSSSYTQTTELSVTTQKTMADSPISSSRSTDRSKVAAPGLSEGLPIMPKSGQASKFDKLPRTLRSPQHVSEALHSGAPERSEPGDATEQEGNAGDQFKDWEAVPAKRRGSQWESDWSSAKQRDALSRQESSQKVEERRRRSSVWQSDFDDNGNKKSSMWQSDFDDSQNKKDSLWQSDFDDSRKKKDSLWQSDFADDEQRNDSLWQSDFNDSRKIDSLWESDFLDAKNKEHAVRNAPSFAPGIVRVEIADCGDRSCCPCPRQPGRPYTGVPSRELLRNAQYESSPDIGHLVRSCCNQGMDENQARSIRSVNIHAEPSEEGRHHGDPTCCKRMDSNQERSDVDNRAGRQINADKGLCRTCDPAFTCGAKGWAKNYMERFEKEDEEATSCRNFISRFESSIPDARRGRSRTGKVECRWGNDEDSEIVRLRKMLPIERQQYYAMTSKQYSRLGANYR